MDQREVSDTYAALAYGVDVISPSTPTAYQCRHPRPGDRPVSYLWGCEIVCLRHKLNFNQGAVSFTVPVSINRKVGMLISNACFHWLLLYLRLSTSHVVTAMTKSGIGFIQNSMLLSIVRLSTMKVFDHEEV